MRPDYFEPQENGLENKPQEGTPGRFEALENECIARSWQDLFDAVEVEMNRRQEIERLIVLHEQALELLMENPPLFAKEIDRKEQDLAALRMQLAEAA